MIEIQVDHELYAEAEERNKAFQAKYGDAGTHRTNKDRQRMTGYLAEVAVRNRFITLEYYDQDEIDLISNLGFTFDVKSQGCNSKPQYNFVCTLYEEQAKRPTDFYIFCRTKNDFSIVWICGFLRKHEYLHRAKLIPAGTTNNNFTYDETRYELAYSQLYDPRMIDKVVRK